MIDFLYSKEQLREIKGMNFAKLICLVTDVVKVPSKGFVGPSRTNDYIFCKNLKLINFHVFKAHHE